MGLRGFLPEGGSILALTSGWDRHAQTGVGGGEISYSLHRNKQQTCPINETGKKLDKSVAEKYVDYYLYMA